MSIPERRLQGGELVSESWPDDVSGPHAGWQQVVERLTEVVRQKCVQDRIDAAEKEQIKNKVDPLSKLSKNSAECSILK